jgi:hypothetical protein
MDKAKKDGCVPANPIVGEDVGINTWLNKLPGNNYVRLAVPLFVPGRLGRS